MSEISGVKLDDLQEPIRQALSAYEEESDGLEFDLETAGILTATPDKPNSARSRSAVHFKRKNIGDLYVIAFKPGDGTGDEKTHSLEGLITPAGLPKEAKIVPRSKAGIAEEAHLALFRHRLEDVHADPELFGGTFDLISLAGNLIYKAGELGHPIEVAESEMTPTTTYTVGTRAHNTQIDWAGERFGDPHAVYSPHEGLLQVAGFLAIYDEVFKSHPEILASLHPVEPRSKSG